MIGKDSEAYEELKASLRKELHEGVVTVTFVKESTGTTREMVCTLASRFLPQRSEVSTLKATRKTNPDACVVYDLQREDWRSFRYESVVEYKTIDGVFEPKDVRVTAVMFTPTEE